MEHLIHQDEAFSFWVSHVFQGGMLAPIIENLLVKAQGGWDDYDEVYHCCQLVAAVAQSSDLSTRFYTVRRDGHTVGLGLMTSGHVACPLFFPAHFMPPEPQETILVFNYFHVAPQARGIGSRWLRDIMLPHCAAQGYRAVYVKSSHPKVFPLYARLGTQVGSYTGVSDNGIYTRPGKMFRLPLITS